MYHWQTRWHLRLDWERLDRAAQGPGRGRAQSWRTLARSRDTAEMPGAEGTSSPSPPLSSSSSAPPPPTHRLTASNYSRANFSGFCANMVSSVCHPAPVILTVIRNLEDGRMTWSWSRRMIMWVSSPSSPRTNWLIMSRSSVATDTAIITQNHSPASSPVCLQRKGNCILYMRDNNREKNRFNLKLFTMHNFNLFKVNCYKSWEIEVNIMGTIEDYLRISDFLFCSPDWSRAIAPLPSASSGPVVLVI